MPSGAIDDDDEDLDIGDYLIAQSASKPKNDVPRTPYVNAALANDVKYEDSSSSNSR